MALIIDIKVVTQSGKQALIIDKSGILKCLIKSAPENGKANREVIEIVANMLKITKKSVEIIQGLTSRKKRLAIQTNLSFNNFIIKIFGEVQKKLF
jgi:uncharacterized protein